MSTRSKIATASLITLSFAGYIYSQPQSSPAEQLQATIQRLQNEIKALQNTLAQMKSGQKTAAQAPASEVNLSTTAQSAANPRSGPQIREARAAYNEGRRMEDQKLYRAAVEAYAKAIQLDSMNDAAFLHRAYCFHQLGEDNAAIADFTEALAVQPNSSRAYLGRATSYAAIGERAKALDDSDEALRRDPNSFESYLLRGRLYQQQGDSARALADFTAAQTIAPQSEQPYLSRAELNLRDGKTDEAISDCDAAVRLNPNAFSAYLCRAHAYIQMGKSDRAIEEVSRASQAAQALDMPMAFLNDTWQALDPKAPVQDRLRPPDTVPAKSPTAPADSRKNTMQVKATGSAQPPLDLNAADTPRALEKLARSLAEKHDFSAALAALDRAVALDPTRAKTYDTRGRYHMWKWEYDKAIADFSEAIRLNPVYAPAYRHRGYAHRTVGDEKLAKQDYRKAYSVSGKSSALTAKR
ncbi:MAG: tetratricopeptide repeat protein [Bryobacteraceae bacterium]